MAFLYCAARFTCKSGNSGLAVDETGTRVVIFWGDKLSQVGPSTFPESRRFGVMAVISNNLVVRVNA